MQAYTGFAEVYDRFMNNVPYDEWEQLLVRLLEERGITEGLVLELGCGTGTMTERMAARGYDMIGVDLSEDMLSEAMEKRSISGQNILYLQQDMREFELYGTVAAIYSVCDSLNYIIEEEDLVKVFSLVNNYLDPGGAFIFDFNTPTAYRSELRRHPIVEEQDDITMIWENEYDEESALNEHRVTFFLPSESEEFWEEECDGPRKVSIPREEQEPVYVKVQEIHEQRAYTLPEIRRALAAAGLTFIAACDAETGEILAGEGKHPAGSERTLTTGEFSSRIFCIAAEHGK